jgi:hypothetical protein
MVRHGHTSSLVGSRLHFPKHLYRRPIRLRERSDPKPDAIADTDAHSHAVTNADANANPDSHTDPDAHTYADGCGRRDLEC